MAKTTFERLTDCDFEIFKNEDLAIMLKEVKAEIDKREKEKWDYYFYKVIEDIEALIKTFGEKVCCHTDDFVEDYDEEYCDTSITWGELKAVLMNYNDLESGKRLSFFAHCGASLRLAPNFLLYHLPHILSSKT